MGTRSPVGDGGPAPSLYVAAALRRSAPLRYGLAIVSAVLILLITGALYRPMEGVPFAVPLLLLTLVAVAFGSGAGLVAALLSLTGILFLYVEPRFGLAPVGPRDLALLSVFGTASVLIIALVEQMQRAIGRLEGAERRFRATFEQAASGVIHLTVDGRFIRVNRRFAAMLGREPQAIVCRTFADFTYPPDIALVAAAREDLLAGRRPIATLEKRNVRADGVLVWVHVTLSLVRAPLGDADYLVGVVEDITERREMEEALRASEERLRLALEFTRLGTFDFDPRTGTVIWDDFERLQFGLPSASGDDQPVTYATFLAAVHPDDRERVEATVADVLAGRTAGEYAVEYRAVGIADGRTRWLAARGRVLFDEAGRPERFVGTTLDISERKAAEAEVARLNAELRARVDELTRTKDALSARERQLAGESERKSEFLAVLSHELRNPLAPIGNSLFVLDHAAPGSERGRRALEVLGRQVAQLQRLVDDLLDVTRITRNKVELQRARHDLVAIVRATVEDQRDLFERGGVRVEAALPEGPIHVEVDRARIEQVVGNLLHNAAKFTEAGGLVRVAVESRPEVGRAAVRVADTGAGIAPEMLPRLFQPFAQGVQTIARSRGGLGLGLALVKELVELHGGRVAARSEGPGRGAEFEVELELDAGGAAEEPTMGMGRPGGGLRVLVIEDNPDAASSLCEVLELLGHVARAAPDGPRGVAAEREWRPDVVLCDIGLPGMDGYEVARVMRRQAAGAREPVLVALSGYALPEDVEKARASGFDRHLAKPPDLPKLEEVLQLAHPVHD